MLAVAVDLHDGVCPVIDGVAEAGAKRAADAEVDRQSNDDRTGLLGHLGGVVGAGVVDDDAVVALRADGGDDVGDARLFVVGRHDDDDVVGHVFSSSLTRRASRAWASAVVRSRSCSSETLIDSWIEIASSSNELSISSTAVGVMLATLPRRPTNGMRDRRQGDECADPQPTERVPGRQQSTPGQRRG